MVTVGDCGWDGEMVRARELLETAGKVAVQLSVGYAMCPLPLCWPGVTVAGKLER